MHSEGEFINPKYRVELLTSPSLLSISLAVG